LRHYKRIYERSQRVEKSLKPRSHHCKKHIVSQKSAETAVHHHKTVYVKKQYWLKEKIAHMK
jgi:hypothetical protein